RITCFHRYVSLGTGFENGADGATEKTASDTIFRPENRCQTPFFRNGTGTAGDKGKPSLPPRSIPVSVSDGSRLVRLVDDVRLGLAGDDRVVDNNLGRVRHRRQIVHRVEQHALEDRAQAPSTGLALHRLLRDRSQRVLAELELDALHLEEL